MNINLSNHNKCKDKQSHNQFTDFVDEVNLLKNTVKSLWSSRT